MGVLDHHLPTPNVSERRLKQLRWFILIHIVITLCYEVIWTYFSIKGFEKDLVTYDTDEIWKREFFKATRNFFIFTEILNFLILCIGAVATHKRSRLLMCVFFVMFIMEWGFELIGIYASGDFNIFIYKVICQATKPTLALFSLLNCWIMKEPSQ